MRLIKLDDVLKELDKSRVHFECIGARGLSRDIAVCIEFINSQNVIDVITCIECENYEALNIVDQFGNIVKHTGRGYCKHISQRGERHDDDWCKWGEKKAGIE